MRAHHDCWLRVKFFINGSTGNLVDLKANVFFLPCLLLFILGWDRFEVQEQVQSLPAMMTSKEHGVCDIQIYRWKDENRCRYTSI